MLYGMCTRKQKVQAHRCWSACYCGGGPGTLFTSTATWPHRTGKHVWPFAIVALCRASHQIQFSFAQRYQNSIAARRPPSCTKTLLPMCYVDHCRHLSWRRHSSDNSIARRTFIACKYGKYLGLHSASSALNVGSMTFTCPMTSSERCPLWTLRKQ